MFTQIVSSSGNEPVTSTEAKTHLGIYGSSFDTHVNNLIAEARDYAERCTQRTLRDLVTRKLLTDAWPSCGFIDLPWPPALTITSVTYYDVDNASQTVSSSDYRLTVSAEGLARLEFVNGYVYPGLTVRQDAVIVNYTTGYSSGIPAAAKSAIKLVISALWDQDDDGSTKVAWERADSVLHTLAMPRYA